LWAAYSRPDNKRHPYFLSEIDQLTTFADYRVPQILREMGVLVYSADLSAVVDAKETIASSTRFEVEIRASTVVAVDKLHQVCRGLLLLFSMKYGYKLLSLKSLTVRFW